MTRPSLSDIQRKSAINRAAQRPRKGDIVCNYADPEKLVYRNPIAYKRVTKPAPATRQQARSAKYRNVKTTIDGIEFASKKESKRYSDLILMVKARKISCLKLQPYIECFVNDLHVCNYIADFSYIQDGQQVWEDCKGFKTPVYRLKKKLVMALHGIDIRET